MCKVLSAIHTLTGCDYTNKVETKHVLLASPAKCLSNFGTILVHTENLIALAEEYLTHILKKGTTFKTVDQLKSHIYHQIKGIVFEELPPTSYATRFHILRAFFANYLMDTLLSPKADSLEVTLYGAQETDKMLIPTNVKHPITEEYAVHCKGLKCGNRRCR